MMILLYHQRNVQILGSQLCRLPVVEIFCLHEPSNLTTKPFCFSLLSISHAEILLLLHKINVI